MHFPLALDGVRTMVSPTLRIRSIYDIALIKLIKDNLKYELVQPTVEQSEIFGIEENHAPYDIEISDVLGGYGISIEAEEEHVSALVSLFQEKLSDSIIIRHPVQLHAIYNGRIVHVNYQKKLCIVDIGEDINAILFGANYRKGQKVVVQIKQLNVFQDQLPVCSTVIHFPGQSVILERDASFVRVSRKLSKADRDKLFNLGKQLRPKNHGLIMRTSAVEASIESLQADIEHLVQQSEELDLLISGSSYGPGILQLGHTVAHVIFVKNVKDELTNIRNTIVPTLPQYHWFMSYSTELKLTTTFAESISDKVDSNYLSRMLKDVILKRDFPENALINIQEYHLNAPPVYKIAGQLTWEDNNTMVIKRTFRTTHGTHYDLGIPIQQGDSLTLITKEGSWTLHKKIHRNNKLLGEIIDIVTPIELYSKGNIRYINLGIRLVKTNGKVEVINKGTLDDLKMKKIVSEQFSTKVNEITEICMEKLERDEEAIIYL